MERLTMISLDKIKIFLKKSNPNYIHFSIIDYIYHLRIEQDAKLETALL